MGGWNVKVEKTQQKKLRESAYASVCVCEQMYDSICISAHVLLFSVLLVSKEIDFTGRMFLFFQGRFH